MKEYRLIVVTDSGKELVAAQWSMGEFVNITKGGLVYSHINFKDGWIEVRDVDEWSKLEL